MSFQVILGLKRPILIIFSFFQLFSAIFVTFLRNHPVLKSIESHEADSQKNGGKKGGTSGTGNISESANEVSLPLHGLDTLKDDVTGAVVKILHAFGRHTIESDFKRIELRPYYENYRDIISN